jgi:hypothetical protein
LLRDRLGCVSAWGHSAGRCRPRGRRLEGLLQAPPSNTTEMTQFAKGPAPIDA